MSESIYKPTKELEDMAIEWGRTSGAWCNFAEHIELDQRTAEKYYGKFWRKGKNDVIMAMANDHIKAIKEGLADAKDSPEKIHAAKAIDSFLSKRSPEWSTKQQIEQTNVNVETNQADYSKLSEEEKATMRAIMLKIKG